MAVAARLRADTAGATAAEYAVLLGVIGAGIALASLKLGGAIGCSVNDSSAMIAGVTEHRPGYGRSDPSGLAKGHRKRC